MDNAASQLYLDVSVEQILKQVVPALDMVWLKIPEQCCIEVLT
jgi:hypothetical protein